MATILIVDDDPQVCEVLEQIILNQGHRVYSALNGEEGISLYRQHLPDLVFLDILMPQKEGLETILEIRQEFPNVKIIAMSAASEGAKIDLLELAQRLGAQYRMPKPFELKAVTELVNTALRQNVDS